MRVWIIDDLMSKMEGRAYVPDPAELAVSAPHDDDFSDRLKGAWDLILIDENFEEEPGTKPTIFDGSSLVGWLRAEARRTGRQLPAIAIFTTQPDLFAKEVPAVGPARPLGGSFVGREAHLAPVLDVEWLFAKNGRPKTIIAGEIAVLAKAQEIARLELGNNGASFEELISFLQLPQDVPWRPAAISSLERSRPPISQADDNTYSFRGPVSAVRWLLHDTLPFPGAFLSDAHAASRLGVTVASLTKLVENPVGVWATTLSRAVYTGPAAGLFGRRWWAAGIADALLGIRSAVRAGEDAKAAIQGLSGVGEVAMLRERDPVAVVDRNLKDAGIAAARNCVQLRPRGWPPQCEEPWMRIRDAESAPWFRHMVDPSDQVLLSDVPDA